MSSSAKEMSAAFPAGHKETADARAELDNICRVVCDRKVFDLPNEIRRFKPPNLQTFQRDRVEVIEDFAG